MILHQNVNLLAALALGVALSLAPAKSIAQTIPAAAGKAWTGYAGAGLGVFPKYTGGKGTEAVPVPLLLLEYKETFYVDFVRAGVRLWSSDDKKLALGLAAEPRFGYKAGDGALLGGMNRRRHSLEAGPNLEWETRFASISVGLFSDVTGASKGSSLRALAYKQLIDNTQWDVGVYAGLEREDRKVTNYYFGVQTAEANANRAAYQPGAASHGTLGIAGAWKFSPHYVLLFGIQNTRLGGAAAGSPIVETRNAPLGYVGLGWQL